MCSLLLVRHETKCSSPRWLHGGGREKGIEMTSRTLMRVSALFMGVLGLCGTFLPQEILAYAGGAPRAFEVLAIQVAGALYLGFAFLNWMAQANLIGGIYSRPVAMGNVCH